MCGCAGVVMYHVMFFRPAKQEAGGMCVFVYVYASTVTSSCKINPETERHTGEANQERLHRHTGASYHSQSQSTVWDCQPCFGYPF